MKRLIIILSVLPLISLSCHKEPIADATFSPQDPWVGETVRFLNLSQNAEYVEWDMGDGGTSTSPNLDYFYYDPGRYNVTLRAFGKGNDVSVASFAIDVYGSDLKIIVKEVIEEYVIEGASVVLFNTWSDWLDADYDKIVDEQFTNSIGECFFSDLSYQRYYVDVYYQVGNEGYVNWLLGEESKDWVETQELPGGYDHTFIAYVDAVTFEDQKKAAGRPLIRPSLESINRTSGDTEVQVPFKENKTSLEKERK